jgi:ligand-binding sensor protein
MQLTDLQSVQQWKDLEEDINRKFKLDVNVFNTDGIRITDFKYWANRLCPAIKDTDKGQSFICAVAHMNVASTASQEKKPIIEECDAGFMKLVVPIFVGSEFVGAVGACGVLLDSGEVDPFYINKVTEIDEEKIESLVEGAPAITRTNANKVVDFIQQRLKEIVA